MTPTQKQRADKIFTAEKIIDVSKGIDNEERLSDSLDASYDKIRKLQSLIKSYQNQNEKLIGEIFSLNEFIRDHYEAKIPSQDVAESIKFWKRFHMYSDLYVPNLEVKQAAISVKLMYQQKSLSIGAQLGTLSLPETDGWKKEFYIGPVLSYQFF